MIISNILKTWYRENKRDLPWRNTCDPYHVWVSEIMLQQTRVGQGLDYYLRFIDAFPDIENLAASKIDRVLKLWQGLGYYSRARNMHEAARHIHRELGGRFPDNYDDLLKLKGVGDYTAAAIASICFGQAVPVLDGNVFRVLSRLFGIREAANDSRSKKTFRKAAAEILDESRPGDHNQAIMEFGALCCLPSNPDCDNCPLRQSCYALTNNLTGELPLRKKKEKIRRRYFHYLVIETGNSVWLNRRTGGEIWNMLYEFPLIETSSYTDPADLILHADWKAIVGTSGGLISHVSPDIVHKLSHQLITARFYHISGVSDPGSLHPDCMKTLKNRISDYPVPQLLANYINEQDWQY